MLRESKPLPSGIIHEDHCPVCGDTTTVTDYGMSSCCNEPVANWDTCHEECTHG